MNSPGASPGRRSTGSFAYKERMGWQFPYVSTYNTDFPFDFGLAMTEEQAEEIPEVKEMIDNPPDSLAGVVRAGRGRPGRTASARVPALLPRSVNGTIDFTYQVMAPYPFSRRTIRSCSPHARAEPEEPRAWQGRLPGLTPVRHCPWEWGPRRPRASPAPSVSGSDRGAG